MSQYEESNPHFWPQSQPDYPGPYHHLEPDARQQWEPHPDEIPRRPGRIQTRTRPRPSQPSPVVVPPQQRQPQLSQEMHPPPEDAYQPSPAPPSGRQHTPHSRPAQPQPQPQPKKRAYLVRVEQSPQPRENLMPTPNKTGPITWFGAVFCVILWLVIILGGLLVLIIYLVYRPQTPHFGISSATLNAAYLDMGYLLNADLTVLANFTNPNKKVNVDFSYVTLRLYFDKLLIANQYVGPFSAVNTESRLVSVEFICSQIRLPSSKIQQLATQLQRNRVMFEIDGIFHARSNFGSLLRYSYWLYGRCIIEMTGPPTGVMIASKCKTKE